MPCDSITFRRPHPWVLPGGQWADCLAKMTLRMEHFIWRMEHLIIYSSVSKTISNCAVLFVSLLMMMPAMKHGMPVLLLAQTITDKYDLKELFWMAKGNFAHSAMSSVIVMCCLLTGCRCCSYSAIRHRAPLHRCNHLHFIENNVSITISSALRRTNAT